MDPQRLAAAKRADLLALIGHDTELVRIAGTLGGEWAGPCPFCGGTDRLHVNPARPGGGRWYCRQCTPRGGDAIDYVRRRDHLCFGDAVAHLADGAIPALPAFQQKTSARNRVQGHAWQESGWQRAARRQVQRAVLALASAEGQIGRAYLAGRGLDPATWEAWRLGYTVAWHPCRRSELPAITLPWEVQSAVQAVQYRFLPSSPARQPEDRELTKDERFGQRAGGERLLFGLDRLDGLREVLVLVEGELNALSIWQVWREQAHVLSWGPQSNILRGPVLDLAAPIASRYRRVVVWADERPLAAEAAATLGLGERGRVVHSEGGLDANDRLRCGTLSAFLAPHLAL
jgi:hypothetical protein